MITSISLNNFRSYQDSIFEFEPGVNIIVGPNASGKTNIIESILLASNGSGYRGRDINLIKHDSEWSKIEMTISNDSRVIKIQKENDRIKKTIEIDEQKKSRMPKGKIIQSVLFEPNHLLMFHGGPDMRRDFMDDLLSIIKPEYAYNLRQYKRALAQRNNLLRYENIKLDELFIWNLRLSDLGGLIVADRCALIQQLNQELPDIYRGLSGTKANIRVEYISKNRTENYASDMLKNLESNLEIDIARKHTTTGPHRDDMNITINGYSIKDVASRGEVRTVILACKVFEVNRLHEISGNKPIILLDDVFSELDGSRRRSLTSFLDNSQVFITTTDADVVVQYFLQKCHIIPLG